MLKVCEQCDAFLPTSSPTLCSHDPHCSHFSVSTGAVYYYQRSSDDDGRYEFVQKIMSKEREVLDQFGGYNRHLAVDSNGDMVAIATHGDHWTSRSVHIFVKYKNHWEEVAIVDAPPNSTHFGEDILISQDKLLISSWKNTYSYKLNCL